MIRKTSTILTLVVAGAIFATASSRQSGLRDGERSTRSIVEGERQWVEAVASGDSEVPHKILADDFRGVEPDGTFYDKTKEVANISNSAKEFASNHLDDVNVRLYGDTAVAQGSESWVRRSGSPKRGKFVWTDTWVRRNGTWQVVASEDVMVAEAEK